jgi:hypothetical protein
MTDSQIMQSEDLELQKHPRVTGEIGGETVPIDAELAPLIIALRDKGLLAARDRSQPQRR